MSAPKAIAALLKKAKAKSQKIKTSGKKKIDEKVKDLLTPKQLKEERKKVAAEKRRKAAAEKKKNREAAKEWKLGVSEQGTKKRITQGKKASADVEKKIDEAVGSRLGKIKSGAKISGAGALATAGVMNKDKIMKALENEADKKAQQKEADKKKADERAKGQMTGFAKTSKARTERMAAEKKKKEADAKKKAEADAKKKEASSKVKTSLFGKVTGKGAKDRNVTVSEGKKLANVTREQLTKLGLDPSKKSDLRKYLNAFDRMGTRPTKKSDLVAGKMMGGMMKSKGMAKGGAMKKKGYFKGGAVIKSKRGMGAANRGGGAIMR